MLGAIAGDMIGSIYEFHSIETMEFPLFSKDSFFTDDSVLTLALADSILNGRPYVELLVEYAIRYPHAGYGSSFRYWVYATDHSPYNSFGNGAAMRISPAAYAADTLEEVLALAEQYTAVTHNHPEGIKGGQATAMAVYLARKGASKAEIKQQIQDAFHYDLDRRLDDIRPGYHFDVTCQGTVPEAILAFLESTSFENAIRLAVTLGGDADTLACITGAIAEPFYGGVPEEIRAEVRQRLDPPLWMLVETFYQRFIQKKI